jgi:23S rRNA (guanine745-N1)-methyltransferase
MHFICPLCHQLLIAVGRNVACCNQHHFDRAKEGYFNLLPVQHKHSREPGDAKDQLLARRQFLTAGYFAPLLPKVREFIPASIKTLLDIGCGEGYFTHHLTQHLDSAAEVYGIDIAKSGVKLAAKRYSGHFAVASSFALPIADSSMEVVTRIYAPSADAELRRVLTLNGQLIIVTPGEHHLSHLRKLIYAQVRPHPTPQPLAGFEMIDTARVSFSLGVPAGEMTAALLQMTPYSWRLAPDLKQQLILTGIDDEADFYIGVYRRTAGKEVG